MLLQLREKPLKPLCNKYHRVDRIFLKIILPLFIKKGRSVSVVVKVLQSEETI